MRRDAPMRRDASASDASAGASTNRIDMPSLAMYQSRMPKALSDTASVQLAPVRVRAEVAARIAAYVARPSPFPPSASAVIRASIEAGLDVLERGAPVPSVPIAPAVQCAPARAPRPRRSSDEKRAAERDAARAAERDEKRAAERAAARAARTVATPEATE